MGKNIVFCADGTWNGPGEVDTDDKGSPPTNVFKLFLNLDGKDSVDTYRLANEQERVAEDGAGHVLQIAKYLHGVGDSDNFLVKMMGGTLGAGLITRIVRGYTFVSRNYAAGDSIFLIGFSRGAYTARALAGLIAAKGLLDATALDLSDKENAYRLGAAVWYDYRKSALRANEDWLSHLEEEILDLPGFMSKPATANLIPNVPIAVVAVWDTVGALGIPEYNRTMTRIDAFRFCDTKLSPSVSQGLHAVAVDEKRRDFTPTLWDTDSRAKQVLFPGAHADVGGGYSVQGNESGLSDGALAWMVKELSAVRFAPKPSVVPTPDAKGVAHQPWTQPPWTALVPGPSPRAFPASPQLAVHHSVFDRMAGGPAVPEPRNTATQYNPVNLGSYAIAGKPTPDTTVV